MSNRAPATTMSCYEVEMPDGSTYWVASDLSPIEIAVDAATRAGMTAADTLPRVRVATEKCVVVHG